MKKYTIICSTDFGEREYADKSRNVLKAAAKYGRSLRNEVVSVYYRERLISRAVHGPSDYDGYHRVTV